MSVILLLQTTDVGIKDFSVREGLPYFVPGFCYFINNNLSFTVLSELDPATFSVSSLPLEHF